MKKHHLIITITVIWSISVLIYTLQPVDNGRVNSSSRVTSVLDKQKQAQYKNNNLQKSPADSQILQNNNLSTKTINTQTTGSQYKNLHSLEQTQDKKNTEDRPAISTNKAIEYTYPDINHNNNLPQGIRVIGEKTVKLPIQDKSNHPKKIKLLDIQINKEYRNKMLKKAQELRDFKAQNIESLQEEFQHLSKHTTFDPNNFAVDLEMSNVPVLNQGEYGTCTTFANTAVIDAKMNAGDYISQQCLLELGVNEQANHRGRSGWDGLFTPQVLKRMKVFGVVDKYLCPHTYGDMTASMTEDIYTSYSDKLWSNNISWKKLNGDNLIQLKNALNSAHRVVISTMLNSDKVTGSAINNKPSGLWQLPDGKEQQEQFINDLYANDKASGHTMIVTGYDDNKGLIKIRNSWSKYAGDDGEFYMTYDYYQLMNVEAYEIL